MLDSTLVDTDNRTGLLEQVQKVFEENPTWADFYLKILSPEGSLYQVFPVKGDREAFKQSDEYVDIMEMFHQLLRREETDGRTDQRVITIRLPKPMHAALRHEAYEERLSLNKLCLLRLMGG